MGTSGCVGHYFSLFQASVGSLGVLVLPGHFWPEILGAEAFGCLESTKGGMFSHIFPSGELS